MFSYDRMRLSVSKKFSLSSTALNTVRTKLLMTGPVRKLVRRPSGSWGSSASASGYCPGGVEDEPPVVAEMYWAIVSAIREFSCAWVLLARRKVAAVVSSRI